jgi:hypothetical protein
VDTTVSRTDNFSIRFTHAFRSRRWDAAVDAEARLAVGADAGARQRDRTTGTGELRGCKRDARLDDGCGERLLHDDPATPQVAATTGTPATTATPATTGIPITTGRSTQTTTTQRARARTHKRARWERAVLAAGLGAVAAADKRPRRIPAADAERHDERDDQLTAATPAIA